MCLRDKYIAALAAYAILIVVVFAVRPGGDSAMPALAAAMDLVSISIAVIAGISAIRYFGLSTRQGRSMAFLTAGLFVWLVSEVLWVTAARINGVAATDVTFVLAYPFLIAGIFYGFRTLGLDYRREMLLIPAFVLLMIALAVSIIILWNQNISGSFIVKTLTVYAFSISGGLLMVPVFLLVKRALSGFFSRPWILIGFALVLNVAGQAILGYTYDAYAVGSPVDIITYFSYLAFGAAFVLFEHDTRRFVSGMPERLHGKMIPKSSHAGPKAIKKARKKK